MPGRAHSRCREPASLSPRQALLADVLQRRSLGVVPDLQLAQRLSAQLGRASAGGGIIHNIPEG